MISPRVMWNTYCLPSVVSTSAKRFSLALARSAAKTLSHTALGFTAGPQCLTAHRVSVLLFTMNRLPMPMVRRGEGR